MNVKLDCDFYHYDLCNGSRATPPRHQIILLVVKIIFGILLKCVFGNEINDNEKQNKIELQLEFNMNVNVSIDCNRYEYPLPYQTPAPHRLALLKFIKSREQLVFNYLDGVYDNRIGYVYVENQNVKIQKCEYDFGDLFNDMIMMYLHLHLLICQGAVDFGGIDTRVSAIDILVSIVGGVCGEYDINNEISFGM